jgi:hypothetical protein
MPRGEDTINNMGRALGENAHVESVFWPDDTGQWFEGVGAQYKHPKHFKPNYFFNL